MAILNGRLGRALGEPLHAPVVLFGVGFLFCLSCALLLTQSLPNLGTLKHARPADFLGGLIVGFYVLTCATFCVFTAAQRNSLLISLGYVSVIS